MGCFWSSDDYERCQNCNRKAVNDINIVNGICQICIDITQRRTTIREVSKIQHPVVGKGPFFGEFKCKSCGRYWNSRLCWPNSYQNCKTCRIPVFAYNFRALNPSDMSNLENKKEHPKELCQKCKVLGHYCGFNKRKKYIH